MYMMKILHTADWHLDSPFRGQSPERQEALKKALLQVPEKIAALCRREQCDLVLIAGDLFDRAYSKESYLAAYSALEQMAVPVLITPGNHDYVGNQSPWKRELWPENVTVFTQQTLTRVPLSGGAVWGAAFCAMEAPPLLEGFRAPEEAGRAIGILHGDATQARSPYCPVTAKHIKECGLAYLALGHIHEAGSLRQGDTLCAWPGCPMGRGYDEAGEKGVLIVELGETASTRFVPLDTPRFYDLETPAGEDPVSAVGALLPAAGSGDFYRITLTGHSQRLDLYALQREFSHFPNLELLDKTLPPVDPWSAVGEDTVEGVYFSLLQAALEGADTQGQEIVRLAANISRQLLDGQEVKLP